MEQHTREQAYRGFSWQSKAWYANTEPYRGSYIDGKDEVTIGMYYDSGGCRYEIAMVWKDYQTTRTVGPILSVFIDGYAALLEDFRDVWEHLELWHTTQKGELTPAAFVAIVQGCGVVDRTPYTRPERGRGKVW